MPYTKQEDRNPIDQVIGELPLTALKTPGDLNYAMTRLFNAYLYAHGVSYTTINAIVGAIECTKLEIYRRLAAPYEDAKLSDNGDAYNRDLVFAAAKGKKQSEISGFQDRSRQA